MADKRLISELQGKINALQVAPTDATSLEKNARFCHPEPKATDLHEVAGGADSSAETMRGARGERQEVSFAQVGDHDKAAADAEAAFKKIIALVNVSDRSEKTIRERLEKADFPPAAIDEAVERAKDYRFIDDLRFAAVLARSRIAQGKGIYGIERELMQHRIDPADVPGWPHEFEVSDDDEFSRAMEVLEKRPPRSKNLRDGAFRKLVQRGFSVSVASEAARAWAEAREGRGDPVS